MKQSRAVQPSPQNLRSDLMLKKCRELVIFRIEEMIRGVVDGIVDDAASLALQLSVRGIASTQSQDENSGEMSNPQGGRIKTIRFPGSTPNEAWRFGRF